MSRQPMALLLVGPNYYLDMLHTNTFKHLENTNKIRFQWDQVLFYNSLSKIIWNNKLLATFLKWCEQILVVAIKSIRNIETYYRP